ncbi:MAG TPA: hypothetical protein DDX98_02720 [Bacteroidales bacterium]|jgi:hypothetical protein|nr:hypothetical protein [Bacteroidales bacterium]
MEVVLLAIGVVGVSFLALGVNIFFVKGRNFPETEVGKNKTMRSMGIYCVKCEEGRKYRETKRKLAAKHINPSNLKLDISSFGESAPGC